MSVAVQESLLDFGGDGDEAAPHCGTTSVTATCSSWAAAASAPGSTPSRSRPVRRASGSASSSVRGTSA